jgi:hypothetical protein
VCSIHHQALQTISIISVLLPSTTCQLETESARRSEGSEEEDSRPPCWSSTSVRRPAPFSRRECHQPCGSTCGSDPSSRSRGGSRGRGCVRRLRIRAHRSFGRCLGARSVERRGEEERRGNEGRDDRAADGIGMSRKEGRKAGREDQESGGPLDVGRSG